MRHLPEQEFRRMSEYAIRVGEAQKKSSGQAMPPPTPTRAQRSKSGRPGPGDTIEGTTKDFDGF